MIYLDHHAATPLASAAATAMEEAREIAFANPSSIHAAGRASRALLENAREGVAAALGAQAADVIWTSGGTEACNLGIWGLSFRRIVTSEVEHSAVSAAAREAGVPVERIPAAALREGAFADFLDEGTLLATQWVNHETGSIWPVQQMAAACESVGARLFLDATQALGRVPIDVTLLGADCVAVASHKVGGPSGSGALWVRRDVELSSVFHGGGQERGRRAGSPGVEAIVGFGAACREIESRLTEMPRVAAWRDQIEACLMQLGAKVNGAEGPRVASATNCSLAGWESPVLVAALDMEGLCASAGSACSSGTPEPSAVVAALYADNMDRARSALRLSLGPEGLSDEAIHAACAILERVIPRVRA
ncbi:MAG: cysteine desulfurase family protein [Polyangiales bacterium]